MPGTFALLSFFAVPMGLLAVIFAIRRIRVEQPDILRDIDPAGFRTFYLPSQLLFIAFVLGGGIRAIVNGKTRFALYVWLACCVIVVVNFALGGLAVLRFLPRLDDA